MPEPQPDDRQHISGRDARGGRILLKSGTQRAVFIGGLIGILVVALLIRLGTIG